MFGWNLKIFKEINELLDQFRYQLNEKNQLLCHHFGKQDIDHNQREITVVKLPCHKPQTQLVKIELSHPTIRLNGNTQITKIRPRRRISSMNSFEKKQFMKRIGALQI